MSERVRLRSPLAVTDLTFFGLVLSLVFSLYIVYDTFLIQRKLSPDDYVFAALSLYLDVINLFISILQVIGGRR